MNQSKLLYLLTFLFFISCDPDALLDVLPEDAQTRTMLNIRLTDAPVELDEVNIDLQQVYVKGPGGFEEIPLGTNAGIYNLLDLQNGIDVVIATAEVSLPSISEVRLVLGNDNTVVAAGETYDLKIPSGNTSGLKIKACLDLTSDPQYDLLLDFDAAASIHQTGNGKFIMRPVIHIMNGDAKCTGDDDDGEEDEGEEIVLPANAAEWLEANYGGYELDAKTTGFCGVEVYEVKAVKDQEVVYLYFDADGNYLHSALMINSSDLPSAVTDAVAADYPDYTLADGPTYQVRLPDATIWYRVRLETTDARLNAVYQEDGTLYCDDKVADEDGSSEEEEGGEEEEGEDDEGQQPNDLPTEVIDFVKENFPDYLFTGISGGTLCTGAEVYILKGNKGMHMVWLYFDLDWNFLQSAQPFKEKDLSAEIIAAIAADYPNYKIMNNQAWKITTASAEVQYRVYIKKNNSGDKMYVIYGAGGAFICAEA